MVRKFDFPILWSKRIQQVGDIFNCNVVPPRLLDRNELNAKYFLNIDFLRYHQLKTSILNGLKKLSIEGEHLSGLRLPRFPLLFRIGNEEAKGCKFFYNILGSDLKAARLTDKSETKWHDKFSTSFSS